jgi:translation initiation factor 3 subunit A
MYLDINFYAAMVGLSILILPLQASQIFQSVKIDMLSRMIPFFDFAVVEKISVDAVKRNFVSIKVNHLSGAVHFGTVVSCPDSAHQLIQLLLWMAFLHFCILI